jgi:signal transduction histidine kinase
MCPEASPAPPPLAAPAALDVAGLVRLIKPIRPDTPIATVADLIQRPHYAAMLSVPVVGTDHSLATVSRHQLSAIFLRRYGRELHGRDPISTIMNRQPLVVPHDWTVTEAGNYVVANLASPITEDFVVTRGGRYAGMGAVMDLLAAMQGRVGQHAETLAEAYRQLKASKAALAQAEKLASLGQMVAGLAHEINTPLGYVRNNVEMVRDVLGQIKELLAEHEKLAEMFNDPDSDSILRQQQLFKVRAEGADFQNSGALEDIDALIGDTLYGADTIKELVINLLSFSRTDPGKSTEVNLNDCLDQALLIANSVLKGKVEVIKRYGDIPRVQCSPSQLSQVFLNMFTNAAQAIEGADGRLLVKTAAEGDWVRITIHDNGKGIAAENLSKIFDPFFTTKDVGEGTGLGLSISYQIVQSHGGNITVASVPGKGTKFVISLPADAAGNDAAGAA